MSVPRRPTLPERDRAELILRRVFAVAGVSGLALGLIFVANPAAAYRSAGIAYADPLADTLYGAVLVGVGLSSLRASRRPLASAALLFFVASYKLVAVLALVPRLLSLPDAPVAAWAIVVLWAGSGLVAAWAHALAARVEADPAACEASGVR